MSAISSTWKQWAGRFAALSRRERLTIGGGMLLVGAMLIFNLAIDPQLARIRVASRALATAQSELVQQRGLVADLKRQAADPDAANRTRLGEVQKELASTNERLASIEAGMVPPDRMRGFLEGLLAANRGVDLLGIKTLPPELVGTQASMPKQELTASQPGPAKGEPPAVQQSNGSGGAKGGVGSAAVDGIYQHGIELRLAGSYNDLLAYLVELERMPQQLLWNSVSLTVERYPRSVLVLRVYTLSLERNWLTV
ncbi:MAG: hypothetical protein HZB40_00340 [Rhodocyclales bacterium]|nr:hypothetical protein [Rhodocyclales bacterium]